MSGICAFFGHRDTIITSDLEKKLESVVCNLIESGINEFWCCEQGTFDWLSQIVMLRLKKSCPDIYVCYVLAYPCSEDKLKWIEERFEIIYPEVVATAPHKCAITRRNKYIAENADIIICYIDHPSGGAYQAIQIAKKHKKTIINLAESQHLNSLPL